MKVKDLAPNPKNPCTISAPKLGQLKKALVAFGDLSGIVYNSRTNQLVGGHQRTKHLPEDAEVIITKRYSKTTRTGTVAIGYVLLCGERFSYREVYWGKKKEKAANLAANKSAGEWEEQLLKEFLKELAGSSPESVPLTMFGPDELLALGITDPKAIADEPTINPDPNENDEEPIEEPEKLIGSVQLFNEDCLVALRTIPENCIDAVVTDPPAGIAFMGKEWDSDKGGRDGWITWMTDVMSQCLRVLKPGGHAFVWAIPRTSHWTATALENAGFEVRDVVTHLFGTGFPKSLDISKAIDKMEGAEREVVGKYSSPEGTTGMSSKDDEYGFGMGDMNKRLITAPATDAAKQWQGWGTALKPASEHWILCRKPLSEPTVAKNVLKHGVGGLNIDACRIEGKPRTTHADGNFQSKTAKENVYQHGLGLGVQLSEPTGRFPSNLLLDEQAAEALDAQSGITPSNARKSKVPKPETLLNRPIYGKFNQPPVKDFPNDAGGASRFFYVAKASATEKNTHLNDNEAVNVNDGRETSIDNPFQRGDTLRKNTHPTVKSISLMRWLCRLITPPGGLILDAFMGSGSTGVAALREEFCFIGIEREKEYFDISRKRLNARVNEKVLVESSIIKLRKKKPPHSEQGVNRDV